MDKAKAAVHDFVSRSGKHDTAVDETVAPAVVSEKVQPTRHENLTTAVDREIHQDHYHTTVQPISHQEVKPEVHTHNMLPVQHKKFEHGDESKTREFLEKEAAKFKNEVETLETKFTSMTAPIVEGEHVHHHVHERVQPVINKQTITPEVVHSTIPVHELHHAEVQHHGTSVLPAKTLEEFTSGGGSVTGVDAISHGKYDGCPRPYNEEMQTERTEADMDPHATHVHA